MKFEDSTRSHSSLSMIFGETAAAGHPTTHHVNTDGLESGLSTPVIVQSVGGPRVVVTTAASDKEEATPRISTASPPPLENKSRVQVSFKKASKTRSSNSSDSNSPKIKSARTVRQMRKKASLTSQGIKRSFFYIQQG